MPFEFRRWLVDGVVEKRLFRGQAGHRCGQVVDSQRILKSVTGSPCAAPRQDSRNTSLLETETDPGATPEREKSRETGASGGYLVPVAGQVRASLPGDRQARGERPGEGPATHNCVGLPISAGGR